MLGFVFDAVILGVTDAVLLGVLEAVFVGVGVPVPV